MSDVFISYKAEDRRRIHPLVQALQSDGYSVWWDQHIRPATSGGRRSNGSSTRQNA